MKKVKILATLFVLSLIFAFVTSCEKKDIEQDADFMIQTIEYWGGSFKMVYCPGGTFLTNDDDGDSDYEDGLEVTVEPFWISEVEVTNELLAWIYNCASGLDIVEGAITGGQPIFDTEDDNAPNYLCEDYVKWGDQTLIYMGGSQLYGFHDIESNGGFKVRSSLNDWPCTDITWYGAVMACNWLTGQGVGSGQLSKVYSGIDEDWSDDETECDFGKNGFRLPTSAEWECAARWQGDDSSGDCYEYPPGSGQYWTHGSCASGGTAPANDVTVTSQLAVYKYNDENIENPEDVQDVKGDRKTNILGLYDMSGNTWEWCWDVDESGNNRILRGGSAFSYYHDIRISSTWDMGAGGTASDLGFRLVMSAGN